MSDEDTVAADRERWQRALEDAVGNLKRGRTEAAAAAIVRLSEAGFAPAMVTRGWLHETGVGVQRDENEAARWYGAAASAEDPVAQYYLGTLFLNQGVVAIGLEWLERAAGHRYVPAIYTLGNLHLHGDGVPRSEAKGLDYLRQAAALGHPWAQRTIAVRGLRGKDGTRGILAGLLWIASIPWTAARMCNHPDENVLYPYSSVGSRRMSSRSGYRPLHEK